jgi:signal transduction histidine kinase
LIATRFAVLGRPRELPELYLPLLRRIVIEALLNIARHTHANGSQYVMLRSDPEQ